MEDGSRPDVLILGAGVAGLTCARRLRRSGLAVKLVEARDRPGGRVRTVRDAGGRPIEAGAEFVHGRPPTIMQAIEVAGLPLADVDGQRGYAEAGRIVPAGEIWTGVRALIAQGRSSAGSRSFGELLAEPGVRDLFAPEVLALARAYVEGFYAAPAERASLRSIVESEELEDGAQTLSIVAPGYDRLVVHLAAGLEDALELGVEIESISWRPREVVIRGRRAGAPFELAAAALVVTLPLGVLQSRPPARGAVVFDPPLPRDKHDAIARAGMGAVIKVKLELDAPPWPEGWSVVVRPAGPFTAWWTRPGRPELVTAWSAGSHAEALRGHGDEALAAEAIVELALLLARPPDEIERRVRARHVFDWSRDPFARGGYSYVPAGADDAIAALATPVARTLFFAGEATDPGGQLGTVHGAMETGERAAGELLASRER